MVLKAQFKHDENQFLAKDGCYQIQKFNFSASNDSEICSLNKCKYGVQNTQFRPNSVSGGYVFEGRLTVIAVEDGVEKLSFITLMLVLTKQAKRRGMEWLGYDLLEFGYE